MLTEVVLFSENITNTILSMSNVCFPVCRCLIDARLTGSSSKFMDRTAENKLQFQLEAFRFQGSESGLVSICKADLIRSNIAMKCSKITSNINPNLYHFNSSTLPVT